MDSKKALQSLHVPVFCLFCQHTHPQNKTLNCLFYQMGKSKTISTFASRWFEQLTQKQSEVVWRNKKAN
jgi:hypothetical protein